MPLVCMRELLAAAARGGYGVGAFSIGNMEMVMGAVRAAEEAQSPLILQIAEVRLPYSPLHLIAPVMLAAARHASIPVAVHFDHGTTLQKITEALELGFTSVMFDGSHLPFAENVANTCRAVELGRRYGAAVEAEIGRVGGAEDGKRAAAVCSDPEEARRFFEATGVDALAVSIGNAHGNYPSAPDLRFDVLEQVRARIQAPLVLHGGTGISEEGFRRCIAGGVAKVNIATANNDCVVRRARALLTTDEKADYYALSAAMENGAAESVRRHMRIFMSENKATLH